MRLFLQTRGWPARLGERIGTYRIGYADATHADVPLVYGRNFLALQDSRPVAEGRVARQGKTPGGAPLVLRCLEWSGPHPEREITAIDFDGAASRASPALLAISGRSP